MEGVLTVKLVATAKDDAANEELLRFMADMLEIRKDHIRIVTGRKPRHKVLKVDLPMAKTAKLPAGE